MRKPRKFLKASGTTQYFHVTSRIVNGDLVMGGPEKEFFLKTMRKLESFTALQIITYCLMGNHFHLLLKVPIAVPLSDTEVIKRMRNIYPVSTVALFTEELKLARKNNKHELADHLKRKITRRMFDLSMFMKDLKQRFTQWFNRQHSRRGTLWEERFRSVLLEGSKHVLMTTAAYIDLNPVRAGLCTDPKDYLHSGFGEASQSKRTALERLVLLNPSDDICNSTINSLQAYQNYLYASNPYKPVKGVQPRHHRTFDRAEILKAINNCGSLDFWQLLRCRVRYFTSGTVLGSRSFVDAFFLNNRTYFGPHRTSGARKMRGADWCGIYSLRNLALNLYS